MTNNYIISDDVFYLSSRPKNPTFFFPHFLKSECTKVAEIWTEVALGNSYSHVSVIVENKIVESPQNPV